MILSACSSSASKKENEVIISIFPTAVEFKPVASQITRNKAPGLKPSLRPILTKNLVLPKSLLLERSPFGPRSSRSEPADEAFKSPARS